MHYDICDPEIRCNADKVGASVFEVQQGRRTLLVLTFDSERAHELVRDQDLVSSPAEDNESWLF